MLAVVLGLKVYTNDVERGRLAGAEESSASVTARREVVVMAVGTVELVVLRRERMIDQRHLAVAALEAALVPVTILVRQVLNHRTVHTPTSLGQYTDNNPLCKLPNNSNESMESRRLKPEEPIGGILGEEAVSPLPHK